MKICTYLVTLQELRSMGKKKGKKKKEEMKYNKQTPLNAGTPNDFFFFFFFLKNCWNSVGCHLCKLHLSFCKWRFRSFRSIVHHNMQKKGGEGDKLQDGV